jgi:hypothetical protein
MIISGVKGTGRNLKRITDEILKIKNQRMTFSATFPAFFRILFTASVILQIKDALSGW